MSFSILPLIYALTSFSAAAAAAAGLDGDGVLADHAALIQAGTAVEVGVPAPRRQLPEEGEERPRKKLAVFFDGTGQAYAGNLYRLASRGLINDGRTQVVKYIPGVNTISGHGVRRLGLEGLDFLTKHYAPGDEVLLYGLSRGCLTARWVQGMLHRYGLTKESVSEVLSSDEAEEHIRAQDNWKDVDIALLGCIDGVLRTLHVDDPDQDADMSYMHQEITPTVRNFLHAISLEEMMAQMHVNEFAVPKATHEEQVWFASDHVGVCLYTELISGWLGERSKELGGVLLQEGFLEHLNMNIFTSSPRTMQNGLAVRNPHRCRKEIYGDRRVKVHASVKDRMEMAKGWEPITTCCDSEAFSDDKIEWVTTTHYDSVRKSFKAYPQWIGLTFDFVNITDEDWLQEDLHVMVGSTTGNYRAVGVKEFKRYATSSHSTWTAQDALPWPYHGEDLLLRLAKGPCPSLLECTWNNVHYDGEDYRVIDSFPIEAFDQRKNVKFGGGSILVSFSMLMDDDSAKRAMNSTRPRCEWAKRFLEPSTIDMCSEHPSLIYSFQDGGYAPKSEQKNADPEYPKTCTELRSQVTTGSLRSAGAPSAAKSSLLLLASVLLAVGLQ